MTDRLDALLDRITPTRIWGQLSARHPTSPADWLLAAWHARTAYLGSPAEELRRRNALLYGDFVPFVSGHRRGYLWSSQRTAVVAIAGSDDLRDWSDNVRCACPESAGYRIRVHRGFAAHAEELRHVLDEYAAPLLAGRQVVLCGHSLGGAVCLLLPLLSQLPEIRAASIVTFGAPRAGDAGLRRFLAKRSVSQLANDGDPVPLLPVRGPLFGYRHARPLIHLTDRGTWSAAWHHRYGRLCAAMTAGLLPQSIRSRVACRIMAAVRAHRMASYVDRLLALSGD